MPKTANSRNRYAGGARVREPLEAYKTGPAEKDPKRYDLEERTFSFARCVRAFVKMLPRTLANIEDAKQLIKASGSVGANYIEANEALSKKDFVMRIKICRKEAKESSFFLRLLDVGNVRDVARERDRLVQESTELMSIFGCIYRKSQ